MSLGKLKGLHATAVFLGLLAAALLLSPKASEAVHYFSTKAMQAMEKLVNSNGQIGAETDESGGLVVGNYLEQKETAAPPAPAADRLRIYAKDDGLGNSHLFVRDSVGAETDLFTGGGGSGGVSSLNDLSDVTITPPGYTPGLVLRSNGAEFVNAQLDFSDLTGSATSAQGGTGFTSYTIGDLLYASSASVLSKLGIGPEGKFLTVASGLPAWGDAVDLTTDQTIGGVKTFTSFPITPSSQPMTDYEVANKQNVDTVASGLSVRASCRTATTGNITLSGTQTIDGVVLGVDDRVLVKDQTSAAENGIYDVKAGTWVRSSDYNTTAEVTTGSFTSIIEGTDNANTQWVLVTQPPITLGTTPLQFSQLSSQQAYTASLGVKKVGFDFEADLSATGAITLTGDSLQVAVDDSTIERAGNALQVKDLGVTNAKLSGGIADGKLNTITTANKVNWAAVNKAGSKVSDVADTSFTSLAAGALLYRNSGNSAWVNLPIGTDGQILTISSGLPGWGSGSGGGSGSTAGASADFIPRPNKRKFFLTTATASTYTSVGVSAITTTGTLTNANDSKTTWTNHASSASIGSSGSVRSSSFNLVRRAHDPMFITHVKTGSDITNLRIWVGLLSTTQSNSDTIDAQGIALRYSSGVSPNWFAVTKDGTTQTATNMGLAVAASTDYLLKFTVNSAAGTVTFTVNGGNSTTLSTNLPATATDLGFVVIAYTTTATAKSIAVSRIYCEFTGSEITFAPERKSNSITLIQPTASENVTVFFTDKAVTLQKMAAVLTGAGPSVTWSVRFAADRSTAGTEVVTGGTTTTSITTGDVVTTFNNASIPANSFVWLTTTATSGTVNTFHLTATYTVD